MKLCTNLQYSFILVNWTMMSNVLFSIIKIKGLENAMLNLEYLIMLWPLAESVLQSIVMSTLH